ncbi:hypothetical protein TWF481_011359 [Arthrobotrys musiformis]|uniref:SRR1-like domain-containing protein n=1 Tax=Arthrobotrys musiformis TaxID=47236 RepID=A0AAV9W134_9PEZI
MSARQRHSRITTDDGWTTISTSNSRKPNPKKGKPGKKNSKNDSTAGGAISALLAHKSDLNFHDGGAVEAKEGEIDQAELSKVKTRVEKQIAGFNASECCGKVKEMVRQEFGIPQPPPAQKDRDAEGVKEEEGKRINNVLILALGSLSETFKAAPGYQLAAVLSIIESLKESHGPPTSKPKDTKEEEKNENPVDNSTNLNVLSYDPIYTPIDISILSDYNITTIPAASVPTDSTSQDKDWYENAVVYMPHASVWLNHKYFMYKPKVWIGNGFEIYEDAVSGNGGEVDQMLKESGRVRREEGYVRVEWPEEDWGGGAVFNNLVVYVRRGKNGVDE